MQVTTYKEIKFKSGDIIPAGTEVVILPIRNATERRSHPFRCLVLHNGKEYSTSYTSVIEPPSEDEVEDMMFDSIVPSIGGYDVEPDGYDPDGFPSWLLALGLC